MSHLSHEALLETANALPPLPVTTRRLSRLYSDPNYNLRDVVQTVELDGALLGRVLKLANSVIYGCRPTSSVSEAILRIGSGAVLAISISQEAKPKDNQDLSCFGLTPQTYWRHSITVMACAEELSQLYPQKFGEEFPTAALLHDFGKLVLADFMSDEVAAELKQFDPTLPQAKREMSVLGVTHAQVSGMVVRAWQLSERLIRAVQYHHDPDQSGSAMCYGLCLAEHLAQGMHCDPSSDECGDADQVTCLKKSIAVLGVTPQEMSEITTRAARRLQVLLELYT